MKLAIQLLVIALFLPQLCFAQNPSASDLDNDIQELQRLRQQSTAPLMDLAKKLNINPENVNKMLDQKQKELSQAQNQAQQSGQESLNQLDQETQNRVNRLRDAFGSENGNNPQDNMSKIFTKVKDLTTRASKFILKVIADESVIMALQDLSSVSPRRWMAVAGFNILLFIIVTLFKGYKIRRTNGFLKSLGVSFACWLTIAIGTSFIIPIIFVGFRYYSLVSAIAKSTWKYL